MTSASMRLANVRDLGGLPLADGGSTQPGVLWRGDASYDGDEPPDLRPWPPATVVDLRAETEYRRSPFRWDSAVRVVRHPLHDPGALDRVEPGLPGLRALYAEMVDVAAERIAAVPGLVDPTGPTLVHCAAGKDRTGVVVAALLLAVGVQADAVVADYERTEVGMPAVLDRADLVGALDRNRIDPVHASAPGELVRVVIDRLEGWPGGPRRWHLDHGADPAALDHLRARLTGRTPDQ